MAKYRLEGIILLLITALIWGAAFVAQKLGAVELGAFTLTSIRFFISGTMLLPYALLKGRQKRRAHGLDEAQRASRRQERRTLALGGALCGLCLTAAAVTQQAGIAETTAGKAGFITALYLLFVPIYGFFAGRKAPAVVWLCVLTALGGLYMLCVKEDFSIGRGDLFVLLCAMVFAAHILIVDRFAPRVDGVKLSCIQFFITSLLAAVPMLVFEKPDMAAVAASWAPVLYLGVVSGGIGYTLQILGQKRAEPTAASLIMSLESVFAAIFGVIFLSESFTGRELVGCALVFLATIAAQIDYKRIRLRMARRTEPQQKDAGIR